MTEITVGAPLGASYVNADGTPGRPVDISLLEGMFVKSLEPSGDSLNIVLQDVDNQEVSLTFSPTIAAGTGSKVFLATATYDTSSGVLEFGAFRGGFPSTISVGDVVVFISPSNIDDDQDITVDDQVNSLDRNLFDIDANVVQGHQLSPGRVYWAQRLFEGLFEAYHLALPLGLDQITVPHTVTVDVTNAQLKAIDQAPVELIPAPGAGRAIEIMSVSRTPSGSDRPDVSDTQSQGTPDPAVISGLGYLLYGYVTDDSLALPYVYTPATNNSDGMDVVTNGHFTGTLYAEDQKFFEIVGHQFLQENEAFVLAFGMNAARSSYQYFYSEAEFDNLMTPANDNTLEVVVQYLIHDF